MVEMRVVCPKMKVETSIYMKDELVNLHAGWLGGLMQNLYLF